MLSKASDDLKTGIYTNTRHHMQRQTEIRSPQEQSFAGFSLPLHRECRSAPSLPGSPLRSDTACRGLGRAGAG